MFGSQMQWGCCLAVVLLCIAPISADIVHLFYVYWPLQFLLPSFFPSGCILLQEERESDREREGVVFSWSLSYFFNLKKSMFLSVFISKMKVILSNKLIYVMYLKYCLELGVQLTKECLPRMSKPQGLVSSAGTKSENQYLTCR